MSEYIVDFKNTEHVSHFESLFADFTAPIREEIVRCRDCEYLWTTCGRHYCDLCYENEVMLYDFCSKGKKKEDEKIC